MFRYFIPEDGDDEKHPNIFKVDDCNANSISLEKLKKSFPLPGVFIFRFLRNLNGTMVWLDGGSGNYDDAQVMIPIDSDGLFAKVTRIENKITQIEERKSNIEVDDFAPSVSIDIAPERKQPDRPVPQRRMSDKLIKFDDEFFASPSNNAPTAVAANNDIFDFGATNPVVTNNKTNISKNELLEIDSPFHQSTNTTKDVFATTTTTTTSNNNKNTFGTDWNFSATTPTVSTSNNNNNMNSMNNRPFANSTPPPMNLNNLTNLNGIKTNNSVPINNTNTRPLNMMNNATNSMNTNPMMSRGSNDAFGSLNTNSWATKK